MLVYMSGNELGPLLGEAERRQLNLVYSEAVMNQARRDRDRAVRRALASGASVSEMARLVGITRQSIMRIRDLAHDDRYEDDLDAPTLEEELSWHYDGEPYGADSEGERA